MGKFYHWLMNSTDANWMMIGFNIAAGLLSASYGIWGAAALFACALAGQVFALRLRRSAAVHD